MESYASAALVRRRTRIGLFGLLVAGLIGWIALAAVDGVRERLTLFHMGTARYRDAQWASTVALGTLAAVLGGLAAWLVARFVRRALGLPRASGGVRAWLVGTGAIAVLAWLGVWAIDEVLVRGVGWAPVGSLVLGLSACALFAQEVPRLVKDARAAWAARRPLATARRVPLPSLLHDAASRGARVRVRGRVRPVDAALPSPDGEADRSIYLRGDGTPARVVPFLVEAEGGQALVDVAGDAIAVATGESRSLVDVAAGSEVEIVAHVAAAREGGAYRGGLARLVPGPDGAPLFLLVRAGAARRLLVAALVESLAAALLALFPAALVTLWLAAAWLARSGSP